MVLTIRNIHDGTTSLRALGHVAVNWVKQTLSSDLQLVITKWPKQTGSHLA